MRPTPPNSPEHLCEFATLAFSHATQPNRWIRKSRSDLKQGGIKGLINWMQGMAQQANGKQKQADLMQQLEYFAKQPQRFCYRQVKDMKLPIGSGSIENLIRQVVNLRLKGTGKFWLPEHAEIILHGRCQWAAGAWEHFCTSILTANLRDMGLFSILHVLLQPVPVI